MTAENGAAGGTGGNRPSPTAGYCLAQCETRWRCGSLNLEERSLQECASRCASDYGNPAVYRADMFDAMVECVEELDCGHSIDECNFIGANVASSDPENFPIVATCLAKQEKCGATESPFSDDICLLGIFLVEAAYTAFDACMTETCAEVANCFDALRAP